MPRKKPTSIYRPLLADAWRVTRDRRTLWVFGLFAALLSTGGVVETAAKGFDRLAAMRDVYLAMLRGTFTGAETFGALVRNLVAVDPSRVTLALTLSVVIVALAAVASVASQGVLIAGVGRRAASDREAAAAGRAAFWHLLALNALNKAAHFLLVLFAALPLLALVSRADARSAAWTFLACFAAFPITVAVSSVFMLASVNTVRSGSHALDAVHHALGLFRRHWLAAFETGILMFGVVAAATLALVAALACLSVPFAVVVFAALVAGSGPLLAAVNVLGSAAMILTVFAFAGAATTYQYAVWVGFYDHASVKNRVVSKVHRAWHGR
jgi:hypothetical protein